MDLQSREIRGREFQVEPFEFDAAFSLGVRLAALLGQGDVKSIADLAAAFAQGDGERGAVALLVSLPGAILRAGATDLLGAVLARAFWVSGGKRKSLAAPATRNEAFGLDFVCAFEVVRFVLETNFLDSIKAIAALLPSQSPEQLSASPRASQDTNSEP